MAGEVVGSASIEIEADLRDIDRNLVRDLERTAKEAGDGMETVIVSSIRDAAGVSSDILQDQLSRAINTTDVSLPEIQITDVDSSLLTSIVEESLAVADTAIIIEDVESGQIIASIEDSIASADKLVEVDADASQLGVEIDTVAQVAAQNLSETIQQGLDSVDPSALTGLGGALEETGGKTEGLANKLSLLGVATTAATGGTKNMVAAVSRLGGPVTIATGALVTTLGVGLNKIANEAEEAFLATQRFNRTFGDTAAAIEQIDIGGLNTSLSQLAINLGADDDAIRQAASNLGQLAQTAGATSSETAEFVETLIVLAAQISATNPTLGSMESILPRLSLALAGNARAGRSLGISFTTTQIAAEALSKESGKTADQLTFYDKAAAGARLRTKQLGDTISSDLSTAFEESTFKLKAANQALSEAKEGLGEQFRVPLNFIKRIFAETAADVVNVTTDSIEAWSTLGKTVAGTATDVVNFTAESNRALGKAVAKGDLSVLIDLFDKTGEAAGRTAEGAKKIADVQLAPIINSFAELEAAAAKTPEILTAADRALLSFVTTASSKLPTVSEAFNIVTSSSRGALDSLISKIPTASSAFGSFSNEASISLGDLTRVLNQQVLDQASFFANVDLVIAKGGVDIAQQILSLGPVEGAALAQATAQASLSRIAALEVATDQAIAANKSGQERFTEAAKAALVESARQQLDQQVKDQEAFFDNVQAIINQEGFLVAQKLLEQGPQQGAALASAAATASQSQIAALELSTLNALIKTEEGAKRLGELSRQVFGAVGRDIAFGITQGIKDNSFKLSAQLGLTVQEAARAAKLAIERGSPSRLFAREIGRPIAEGIAVGIDSASNEVRASMKRIVGIGTSSFDRTFNVSSSLSGRVPVGSISPPSVVSGGVTIGEVHVHGTSEDPMAIAFSVGTEIARRVNK